MATQDCSCERPGGGSAAYIPNLVVETHQGRRALFHDDLIKGKVVIINCFALSEEKEFSATEHLARVQDLLGERLGRDVFMYSITADPENDSPRALRAFAERHALKPGWTLVGGRPDNVNRIRAKLFANGGGHVHGTPLVKDCSFGVIRYGNEAAGLWSACPLKSEPEGIIQRVSWVAPRPKPAEPRRGGPFVGRV